MVIVDWKVDEDNHRERKPGRKTFRGCKKLESGT